MGRRRVRGSICALSMLSMLGLVGCGDKTSPVTTEPVASSPGTAETSVGASSGPTVSSDQSDPGSSSASSAVAVSSTPSAATLSAPTIAVPPTDGPSSTIQVPADAPTIQAGVDKAKPGDLVLIEPGIYKEAVFVRTERVVVRGVDRNTVVLDGGDELENGFTVSGNGSAIENLTVHNYVVNGIVFTKKYEDNADSLNEEDVILKGYRASYITAYNNGLYGMYAFFARDGQMDHSYVSGNPDGGIYIGQCNPCNAVITNIVGERNAIGFLGTNASGNLSVINSVWRKNKIGLLPQSEDSELLAPQKDVLLAGNLVEDNNGGEAPTYKSWGYGIVIGGGQNNKVIRNQVRGHSSAGIFVTELAQYLPVNNTVADNTLSGNAIDLQYSASGPKKGTWAVGRNCFEKNRFSSSSPADIEKALPCDGKDRLVETFPVALQASPGDVDYRNVTKPEAQTSMTDAKTAPVHPAVGLPVAVDMSAITLPQ
jgi:Right handed beta helix region